MMEFYPRPNRDAYATIRGYVYQIEITILRWLQLKPQEALLLECGEDIDTVCTALADDPNAISRITEQVKCLGHNLTLRSDEIITAIATFIAHRDRNPLIRFQTRFTTNASITTERSSPIPKKEPGLTVWQLIHQGKLPSPYTDELHGIREILMATQRPSGMDEETWKPFSTFINQATDEQLLELIQHIEIVTEFSTAESMSDKIQQQLRNDGHATDETQAKDQYHRLFLRVIRLLCRPGEKKLCQEDLLVEFTDLALSDIDRQAIKNISDTLSGLTLRISSLEETVKRHEQVLSNNTYQNSMHIPMPIQMNINMLANSFSELASVVSDITEQELAAMRIAWYEGHPERSLEWLKQIKDNMTRWTALAPEIRAKILCFEAILYLERDRNIPVATALADQAHELCPTSNEIRLRAAIALHASGPEEALPLLDGSVDAESLQMRAALLIVLGNIREANSLLKRIADGEQDMKPTAETYRLLAITALLEEDVARAREEIARALTLAPGWQHILHTAAQIDYYSAFAIPLIQRHLPAWPQPGDCTLVKRDAESRAYLARAEQRFRQLLNDPLLEDDHRQLLESWVLACLASDPDQQEQAKLFCQELLERNPAHVQAILWAQTLGWEIDLAPCESALIQYIDQHESTAFHIIALARIYVKNQRIENALSLLQEKQPQFEHDGLMLLYLVWQIKTLCMAKRVDEAFDILTNAGDPPELNELKSDLLCMQAHQTGDWYPALEYLQERFENTGDSYLLFEWCRILAFRGEWGKIAERAEELVEHLPTPSILHFTVHACYEARKYDLCHNILMQHCEEFGSQGVPDELQRVKIDCLFHLGKLPEAISEAKTLVHVRPSAPNRLLLAFLYRNQPDIKALYLEARELLPRHR